MSTYTNSPITAGASVTGQLGGSFGRTVLQGVQSNTGFIVIVLTFCLAAVIAENFVITEKSSAVMFSRMTLFSPFSMMMSVFIFGFFMAHTLYVMVFVRPDRLTLYILTDLRTKFLTAGRLTQGLTVLLLMQPFISAFSSFKILIPVLHPFAFDTYFMELDRLLHGGVDPWIWLHPLLATPLISSSLNFSYNIWFFALFGVVFWQAFSQKDPLLRQQYFYSFLSLWILLGVVAATLLSSGGPVYYGRITGLEDPYAPLMAYLHKANETFPIFSLEVQGLLWDNYKLGADSAAKGISAMPSLHVAITVVNAFLGWRVNRWLGITFSLFAFAIFISSIHLGWHYAVDGYVSIILTGLIWWAAGKWVRRSKNISRH